MDRPGSSTVRSWRGPRDLSDRLRRGSAEPSLCAERRIEGGRTPKDPLACRRWKTACPARRRRGAQCDLRTGLSFSYSFRPKRNPHRALDALAVVAIHTHRVNWVLDADIRAFFDTLDHGWLVKFVEHRIGDRRIVRLIQKWLRAGVLEEGERVCSEEGTVQGGNISPLLANIFLHYVFDLWTQRWRTKQARGDVVAVRYGDDFVVGFEHREEAERFLAGTARAVSAVWLGAAPRQDTLAAVWPPSRSALAQRSGETGVRDL
ncbi:MAG: reverse transcriptase domain-containing protein [Candidatus Binatia bacterium]